ncbi:hypothetical protein CORMATOL_01813 [Corynebacterium matruchotii ATCC 33806]|uniref:Uncharacterized protein n=1 Tax=Corynebacterium matruchotii ATCC 33806 TaxID=566549 RepID=C0E492_9CORY|nr:hypothetical protein CORMATOL_01813 [Corynebacterium matruchotii ATCC 33806]
MDYSIPFSYSLYEDNDHFPHHPHMRVILHAHYATKIPNFSAI